MTKFLLRDVNFGLLVLYYLYGLVRVSGEQVQLPPRVTWGRESQERIIIRQVKGINYMINCTAEGYPTPTFQWRKDDQLLQDQQYIKVFSNGTLYFTSFGSREDGLYQCLATNPLGISLSAKVPLVAEKEPLALPGGDTPQVTTSLTEGDPATLACAETPTTVPVYVKRWYYEKGTTEVELIDRIGTDAEGNLRFAYLKPEDANTYVCGLAPRVAHEQQVIRFYNNIRLEVKQGTIVPTEPRPAFMTGNGYAKVYLTRNATLECYFSGFPLSTITWKNTSNHVITEGKRFVFESFNQKLIISPVLPEDEGSFSCTANNGHGEKTVYINVNVTSPPFKVANQGLTSLVQHDGSDVTLRCQARAASGESLDVPLWYRNGQLLIDANLPDPARYTFSPDRTQLYIRNINKTVDTACFQCNVTNSEGYTFYDGFLRAINSIMISKKPNDNNEITQEDAIDITVHAFGDVCCQIDYLWYFNDAPLTDEELQTPPLVWDSAKNVLIFNATLVSEEKLAPWFGKYKCRVSNTYQQVNVEFSISKKGTVLPKTAGTEFEIWWIAIIVGVLLIIIAILIIFCCVKRNYPRETYQLEKTELKHHLNPKEELLNQSFQEV